MKYDLLKTVEQGGCSAKIPPVELEKILEGLPLPSDPDILVGTATHDDAGVYRLNEEIALVVTTDFFPPVCSDPYSFGEIASANSLSDIYAMGAKPLIALNIMMFPPNELPLDAYRMILDGGYSKAAEAGVSIIGGHSIDDSPVKYGLAVIGTVKPGEVITNSAARPGDILVLTKPVGTGIIMAAHKLSMATGDELNEALRLMKVLNAPVSKVMNRAGIRCATDITGFGLAGHALKMARASGVTIEITVSEVPLIDGVYRMADEGILPGASFRNLKYADSETGVSGGVDYNLKMIMFDAQTSGGMLISVPETGVDEIIRDLEEAGSPGARVVGRVTKQKKSRLRLV